MRTMTRQASAMTIAGLLTFGGIAVMQKIMPPLDGRLWPVATATTYTVNRVAQDRFIVSGEMMKYRNCEFVAMHPRAIEAETGIEFPVTVGVDETIRRFPIGGPFPWGPWTIELPTYIAKFDLIFENEHKCGPLWTTVTRLASIAVDNSPPPNAGDVTR